MYHIIIPLRKIRNIFVVEQHYSLQPGNYLKNNTHDGGRTHNLLIRSQTRCHYATRAIEITLVLNYGLE